MTVVTHTPFAELDVNTIHAPTSKQLKTRPAAKLLQSGVSQPTLGAKYRLYSAPAVIGLYTVTPCDTALHQFSRSSGELCLIALCMTANPTELGICSIEWYTYT